MSANYNKPIISNVQYDKIVDQLPDLQGKTMAITGTTSGTGYSAARTMAQKGARILLLNRPSSRSKAALSTLQTAVPGAEFVPVDCDLQSFGSVRQAARKVLSLAPEGLDVLCNNAGVMALEDKATSDGFDVQMQTNHLSHFLLTHNLYPALDKAAELRGEARIVNHSSVARFGKKLEAKYLEAKGGQLGGNGSSMIFKGARWVRYQQTKLANAAYTAALHEKLKNSNSRIKVVVAHPGFAATSLQDTTIGDGGMGSWLTAFMMKIAGQSQDDGALGIIKAMAAAETQSGDFIGPGSGRSANKGEIVHFPLEKFYDNTETKQLLWSKSEEAIGESFTIA